MNIFYLDSDPRQCAEWMVDKHVVKMILETAQLLSTCHRIMDGTDGIIPDDRDIILYKSTHKNHPCSIWLRESVENYNWLFDHLMALCEEYKFRYGKVHKVYSSGLTLYLSSPPGNLKEWDWTTPRSAMDEQYIVSDDPVLNYRNYYIHGKTKLHAWKNRNEPYWITEWKETTQQTTQKAFSMN